MRGRHGLLEKERKKLTPSTDDADVTVNGDGSRQVWLH